MRFASRNPRINLTIMVLAYAIFAGICIFGLAHFTKPAYTIITLTSLMLFTLIMLAFVAVARLEVHRADLNLLNTEQLLDRWRKEKEAPVRALILRQLFDRKAHDWIDIVAEALGSRDILLRLSAKTCVQESLPGLTAYDARDPQVGEISRIVSELRRKYDATSQVRPPSMD